MFTDVEMAILSQVSYRSYEGMPPGDLNEFLTSNRSYLDETLGGQYTKALDSLIDKTAQHSYRIVAAEENSHTGFAAFAVEGPGHEVTTVCRGTEFDQLFSEETKQIVNILKKCGINDLSAYSTAAITTALTEHGFTGDGFDDVLADIELAFAKESAQQKKMEVFVENLEKEGYNSYYFTGHSLGGNIALHGAMTLNDPTRLARAVTYNAPGYNEEYLEEHDAQYSRIRNKTTNYQNKRDAISEALISPGNVVVVDCIDSDADGIEAHSLNQLALDDSDSGFQKSKSQEKEQTFWGFVFGAGGRGGNWLNETYNWANEKIASWNGTTINVPLSTLQENARIMQDLTDTNADVFDRVYNSLLCLKENGQWQGTALEAIITATEQNKSKFADTISEMKTLADFLDNFTSDIAGKDIQIKNQINAV